MKKIYIKPEIESAPLLLSACIMSGAGGGVGNNDTPQSGGGSLPEHP